MINHLLKLENQQNLPLPWQTNSGVFLAPAPATKGRKHPLAATSSLNEHHIRNETYQQKLGQVRKVKCVRVVIDS